jgi:cell division protein FtsQ
LTGPFNKVFLWRLLVGLLALALLGGTFFWLSQSSLLAVDDIEVEGNRIVSTDEVLAEVRPMLRGQSMLSLSFDDVDHLLCANPFIDNVEIERDFPHTILIRVHENRPFLSLGVAGGKTVVLSAEGKGLAEADNPPAGLPVLKTGEPCEVAVGETAACDDAATGVMFLANVPVSFNYEFSEVTVSGGDIKARTSGGVDVHFGSLEEYGLKFEVLRQLLARTTAGGADVSIDVSVPQRPVTKDNSVSNQEQPQAAVADEEAAEPAAAEETGAEEPVAPAVDETGG